MFIFLSVWTVFMVRNSFINADWPQRPSWTRRDDDIYVTQTRTGMWILKIQFAQQGKITLVPRRHLFWKFSRQVLCFIDKSLTMTRQMGRCNQQQVMNTVNIFQFKFIIEAILIPAIFVFASFPNWLFKEFQFCLMQPKTAHFVVGANATMLENTNFYGKYFDILKLVCWPWT